MTTAASAFALPDHLSAKSASALIDEDDRHLAEIGATLSSTTEAVLAELDDLRRSPGTSGEQALQRDQEIHRLTGRLRMLRRYGRDLCLGRMVVDEDAAPVYIGRLGLAAPDGRRLLVDWRSPAAEPFFGATHANPMGLASRRRFRWSKGRITDYWDEAFTDAALAAGVALDDQSAFIASLAASRSSRMRDVLGTIQSDQDAIIRASSRGTLVVDGGPGTGKTVVALHRAAYLLYNDPRLGTGRGGVLFVGPHAPYLAYVADVLPSLGEEGVATCTLRDLVPQGADVPEEIDAEVARLKASATLAQAVEPAVALYEEPPRTGMLVETPWAELWLSAEDWAEAFNAPDPDAAHNPARQQVWEALMEILVDKHAAALGTGPGTVERPEVSPALVRRALEQDEGLRDAIGGAWPLLEPTDLVGDLYSVPAYLRRCAPTLSPDEVRRLQRPDPHAWTRADLPVLDAARLRLGDPDQVRRRRRDESRRRAEREEMDRVVDHLIATDDSEMALMSMLRGADLQGALVDHAADERTDPDLLAGPFAHVVVDEAQELTDAEWQMLLQRCPSRSFTVVGDRAQARHGFERSWQERLAAAGLDRVELASLTVNYRTPRQVMDVAEPVIRAALPDANVPTSVRDGVPVRFGATEDLDAVLESWRTQQHDGTACVIGVPGRADTPRIRSLSPAHVKGLEFDLVVLVDPHRFGEGIEGAVDRYVAMTRATGELVVLGR
ncbi:RNA polymerase recycling motor ATPase HelR [Nocardioides sambongensis]|uniref:RNA polymerase recycling motor ATPase HelR n=1 Tax=Nocardioides sambongensis TaxID=2589074 RepID=UPI00112668B0|nr:RNA polymerase recycling motor ATPase HelR [Nocardioides sambongensis]